MNGGQHYDVIVVGIGSMGSAAVHTLAVRGLSVLGLEQYGPAHDRGSAHGGSRIIRQSYFEGPEYVPLLQRAFEGWQELQEQSGRDLIRLCGGIYIGGPDHPVVTGSHEAAVRHGLPHEFLDAAEITARFPTMRPAAHAVGVYEPNAGYVRPEETVLAGVDLARRHGAELHFDESVTGWRATSDGGVEVTTATGRYGADRLVLTPGAWAPQLLPGRAPIAVERQVFYWFAPDFTADVPYERYAEGHPVYIEETDSNGLLYGFPMIDGPAGGLKLAFYRQNVGTTTPETIDRTIHDDEVAAIQRRAVQLFPYLTGPLLKAATCMYASAPDDHFVLGRLDGMPQVVVACGFSGHGFKFVPVVGEIVADLVQTGITAHDIDLFDVARPAFRDVELREGTSTMSTTKLDLTAFRALSFDCYGTLIDWEAGIAAVLAPWAVEQGLDLGVEDLLLAYADHEAAVELETPAALYPEVLAEAFRRTGRTLGKPVSDRGPPGSVPRCRTGPPSLTPPRRWPDWLATTS